VRQNLYCKLKNHFQHYTSFQLLGPT
jgi:hypothetical protein